MSSGLGRDPRDSEALYMGDKMGRRPRSENVKGLQFYCFP